MRALFFAAADAIARHTVMMQAQGPRVRCMLISTRACIPKGWMQQTYPLLMQQRSNDILAAHFPADAVEAVSRLLKDYRIALSVRPDRLSKLGDFRPAANGAPHRISVNASLNVYETLLVFLHEVAHLFVFEQCGSRCRAHGSEWKEHYGRLIRLFAGNGCFHGSLNDMLTSYSYRVKASGVAADPELVRALGLFDTGNDDLRWKLLEDLPGDVVFRSRNGRLFRKEERIRKRYRCLCLDNRRHYLIHPAAKVLEYQYNED